MTPDLTEFQPFPKMPRLMRDIIITEKLDGTNAQVVIDEDGGIRAASRTRWITPADDNYGFAGWVERNKDELLTLGPGRHFGEWWGSGIQRRYGLVGGDKRFSLFNVARWSGTRPACCDIVPTLYRGPFSEERIQQAIDNLDNYGSVAAPGFMDPEGIIVFHIAAQLGFKRTIKGDGEPKSLAKAA
jgi:hypothetical protein